MLSRKDLRHAEESIAEEPVGWIALPVCEFDDLLRKGERGSPVRSHVVCSAKAKEYGKPLQVDADTGVEK